MWERCRGHIRSAGSSIGPATARLRRPGENLHQDRHPDPLPGLTAPSIGTGSPVADLHQARAPLPRLNRAHARRDGTSQRRGTMPPAHRRRLAFPAVKASAWQGNAKLVLLYQALSSPSFGSTAMPERRSAYAVSGVEDWGPVFCSPPALLSTPHDDGMTGTHWLDEAASAQARCMTPAHAATLRLGAGHRHPVVQADPRHSQLNQPPALPPLLSEPPSTNKHKQRNYKRKKRRPNRM